MSLSLHTTKKYQVKYGANAINGWDNIEKFLKHLRELNRNGHSIYINEEETEVEIPFDELEELRTTEGEWQGTFQIIREQSDKDNGEAHLEIW